MYTYLIFDLDAHHPKKIEYRDIKDIVNDNLIKINEMVNHFNDETDPTIGKLYINYPMIESFKDSDSFFDLNYKDTCVDISLLSKYKEIVSKKKLSNIRIENIKDDELNMLILQNIFKLNHIVTNKYKELDYKDYSLFSSQDFILAKEADIIEHTSKVLVLNTSLFLLIDYFGNNNSFYDKFIQNTLKLIEK